VRANLGSRALDAKVVLLTLVDFLPAKTEVLRFLLFATTSEDD
jgi:hypothetical protein